MRKTGSGLGDPDTIKIKLDNYARVAQLALKWQGSPVHWRGLNRAIISYCTQNKEPVPDWKGCGFTQLRPFLMNLAGQNRIRFVGDHLVHPDNEEGAVDIVDYEEDEELEDTEELHAPPTRTSSSATLTHAKAISSPKLNKSGSFSAASNIGKVVGCPVCQAMIAEDQVNRHLDECLNLQMLNNEDQNGANNAANNFGAVHNNNNPKSTAAVAAVAAVPQINFSQEDEDDVLNTVPRRGHRGLAGLGKRRRAPAKTFTQNKRTRFAMNMRDDEDESEDNKEEEEEQEDHLVNNNNRLRLIAEQIRTMHQQQAEARATVANNKTHHVHLSDDSDDEDDMNHAQGGGDSRFAEKILDRALVDKECIICYMPMERGQLVATMPCFCQFHKTCLLDWFDKREVCPTHSEMSM